MVGQIMHVGDGTQTEQQTQQVTIQFGLDIDPQGSKGQTLVPNNSNSPTGLAKISSSRPLAPQLSWSAWTLGCCHSFGPTV